MGRRLRLTASILFSGSLLVLLVVALPLLALVAVGCSSGSGNAPASSSSTAMTYGTTTSIAGSTSVPSSVRASSTTTTVQTVDIYLADWGYDRSNLQYLVDESNIIIRGRVAEEPVAQWNSADGKQWKPKDATEGAQFYTTWIIEAEEVFKGNAWIGARIPFRMEGGTVEFNGRLAHYVGNDYPEMKKGDEVIVFGWTKTRIWGASNLPGFWIPAGFFVFGKQPDGRFHRLVAGFGPEGTDAISSSDVRGIIEDVRAGQIRDYFGLWMDNVESLPARPAALPPQFITPPQEIDALRAKDDGGDPVVLPPLGVKTPLWVFADEVDLSQVGSIVTGAMYVDRPVVIVGADEEEVYPYLPGSDEVVFFTPDVGREQKLIAWAPYQGFRTSILMGPTSLPADTSDLSDGEDLYWQMSALTLWKDWREAWRRKPDAPAPSIWPQNRGPYPSSFLTGSRPGDQITRWVWQNGGNIVADSGGRPIAIPIPQRIPAGIVVPPEEVPGTIHGTPRALGADFSTQHDAWLAPGEWDRYVELYQTGRPFLLVQGYDGYRHPAALGDPKTAISPAPPAGAS